MRWARPCITERAFQQQVVQLAKLLGWKVQYHWSERFSPKGWPDLTLARPPHILFVELKTEKGQTTPAQDEWLATLALCGQHVFVWRPSDLETTIAKMLR